MKKLIIAATTLAVMFSGCAGQVREIMLACAVHEKVAAFDGTKSINMTSQVSGGFLVISNLRFTKTQI